VGKPWIAFPQLNMTAATDGVPVSHSTVERAQPFGAGIIFLNFSTLCI